jgi:hypothetical protein
MVHNNDFIVEIENTIYRVLRRNGLLDHEIEDRVHENSKRAHGKLRLERSHQKISERSLEMMNEAVRYEPSSFQRSTSFKYSLTIVLF